MRKYILSGIAALILAACNSQPVDIDADAKQQVKAFAEAYFNYDYNQALPMVTPESAKWLRFLASNITQEDVDRINAQQQEASVEVIGFQHVDDSTAVATVMVTDFMQKDTIGNGMVLHDEAQFQLTVVSRDGKHFIKMAYPPRSGKQNRDSAGDE